MLAISLAIQINRVLCIPVQKSTGSCYSTAWQTPRQTGANQSPIGGRIAITLIPHESCSLHMAPTGTKAVGHGHRHLPDTRPDTGISHIMARCFDTLAVYTCQDKWRHHVVNADLKHIVPWEKRLVSSCHWYQEQLIINRWKICLHTAKS